MTLLKALRPYDLESMTLIPAKEGPVKSDDPHIGVSAVSGPDADILFVVNTDAVNPHAAQLRCVQPILDIDVEERYRVVELTDGRDLGVFSGEALLGDGIHVEAPANSCLLVAISKER
jgi:hypothetical protein